MRENTKETNTGKFFKGLGMAATAPIIGSTATLGGVVAGDAIGKRLMDNSFKGDMRRFWHQNNGFNIPDGETIIKSTREKYHDSYKNTINLALATPVVGGLTALVADPDSTLSKFSPLLAAAGPAIQTVRSMSTGGMTGAEIGRAVGVTAGTALGAYGIRKMRQLAKSRKNS